MRRLQLARRLVRRRALRLVRRRWGRECVGHGWAGRGYVDCVCADHGYASWVGLGVAAVMTVVLAVVPQEEVREAGKVVAVASEGKVVTEAVQPRSRCSHMFDGRAKCLPAPHHTALRSPPAQGWCGM